MIKKFLGVAGAALLLATQAHATLTSFTNESTFDSQGTLAFDSTFNDFGTGFGFPGNPFTRGDVTFHSADNLTWGNSTRYSTLDLTLIGNNYWTPVLGSIDSAPQYSMFGFEVATFGSSPITFVLHTNLGDYTYGSETVADSLAGDIGFRGWIAGSGEYFTGFEIIADSGPGSNLPGITHVKVGSPSESVPDGTSTLGLIGAAMLGLIAIRRSRLYTA